MILRLFLPAISICLTCLTFSVCLNPLFAEGCHNNFTPSSFEEAGDTLVDFIDENFYEQNISFFPTKSFGNIEVIELERGLKKIVVSVKEPTRLKPFGAFNRFNDMVGNLFFDYHLDAYKMSFVPYEARVKYKKKFFGVAVEIYGFVGDNSGLKRTEGRVELIDYTKWVEDYQKCKRLEGEDTTTRR